MKFTWRIHKELSRTVVVFEVRGCLSSLRKVIKNNLEMNVLDQPTTQGPSALPTPLTASSCVTCVELQFYAM